MGALMNDNDHMKDNSRDLFEQEMRDVVPLKQKQVDNSHSYSRVLSPAQVERRRAAVEERTEDFNFLTSELGELVDFHDPISFKKDGVQAGVFQKLKKGGYVIDGSLNLHGKSLKVAREEVYDFINESYRFSLRMVLIRHGRGKDNRAVMKSFVFQWLRQFSQVIAFHSARRQEGGTGAVYVLLKKGEKLKEINRERHMLRRP